MLVADSPSGEVVGYAYSSSYRPRPAYARTREVSVYLDDSARGQGLGRQLYDELLARLRADGVHQVLAVIALPNDASEALHRSCGFSRVGLLPEVGWKFDRWIDTALWGLSWRRRASRIGDAGRWRRWYTREPITDRRPPWGPGPARELEDP